VNEGAEVDMEGEDRGNREGVESVVRESEEEVVQRRKRDQPGVTRSSTISSQFETSTLQTGSCLTSASRSRNRYVFGMVSVHRRPELDPQDYAHLAISDTDYLAAHEPYYVGP
jgi:hypothetical protein